MKRILFFSFVFFLVLGACNMPDQKKQVLRFNADGTFKIAQFTDIHWSNDSPNCAETVKSIQHVLETEKPQLVILTGDIVTNVPAREGWLSIAKIFEEAEVFWALTLGNHDTELGLTGKEVFDIIQDLPFFVGEKGLEMSGCGNYVLPILASKTETTAALLYCFDSHNKPAAHRLGHYDWIRFDQIAWYRKASDAFSSQNNNTPVPALAFFHIPVPEFKNIDEKATTLGDLNESVASPDLNSGLFCSMVEKKDVMGIFVGHDHNNDYIGIEQDIALAYGRISGIDAYGRLERGGRIILLYENTQKFDTWIRTRKGTELHYYYPSGMSKEDEEGMSYLPAKNIKPKKQGVSYKYYEGKRMKSTSQIEGLKPIKTGELKNISLAPAIAQDSIAFEFSCWIKIPERAVYDFYTFSDDGSKLFIDGQVVVDNDGSHSLRRSNGRIALEKGFHELRVLYFDDYMGEFLEVGYSSRNIREDVLPDNILFIAD